MIIIRFNERKEGITKKDKKRSTNCKKKIFRFNERREDYVCTKEV